LKLFKIETKSPFRLFQINKDNILLDRGWWCHFEVTLLLSRINVDNMWMLGCNLHAHNALD